METFAVCFGMSTIVFPILSFLDTHAMTGGACGSTPEKKVCALACARVRGGTACTSNEFVHARIFYFGEVVRLILILMILIIMCLGPLNWDVCTHAYLHMSYP